VIAANHFGYKETVSYHFYGKEHIRVGFIPGVPEKRRDLFDAIERRQVTRSVYENKNIPSDQLADLVITSNEPDVFVQVFDNEEEITSLLPYIREAMKEQLNDKQFQQELAEWIRFNQHAAIEKKDGLKAELIGIPSAPTWLGKLLFSTFLSVDKEVEKVINMVRSSSALLLFVGLRDEKETWVNVGRSYQRIALASTALGIRHAHVNMPCEVISVRKKLKKELFYSDGEPLLMIRLGYAKEAVRSLRRPLDEVLLENRAEVKIL
jgi:hypothetical protein